MPTYNKEHNKQVIIVEKKMEKSEQSILLDQKVTLKPSFGRWRRNKGGASYIGRRKVNYWDFKCYFSYIILIEIALSYLVCTWSTDFLIHF